MPFSVASVGRVATNLLSELQQEWKAQRNKNGLGGGGLLSNVKQRYEAFLRANPGSVLAVEEGIEWLCYTLPVVGGGDDATLFSEMVYAISSLASVYHDGVLLSSCADEDNVFDAEYSVDKGGDVLKEGLHRGEPQNKRLYTYLRVIQCMEVLLELGGRPKRDRTGLYGEKGVHVGPVVALVEAMKAILRFAIVLRRRKAHPMLEKVLVSLCELLKRVLTPFPNSQRVFGDYACVDMPNESTSTSSDGVCLLKCPFNYHGEVREKFLASLAKRRKGTGGGASVSANNADRSLESVVRRQAERDKNDPKERRRLLQLRAALQRRNDSCEGVSSLRLESADVPQGQDQTFASDMFCFAETLLRPLPKDYVQAVHTFGELLHLSRPIAYLLMSMGNSSRRSKPKAWLRWWTCLMMEVVSLACVSLHKLAPPSTETEKQCGVKVPRPGKFTLEMENEELERRMRHVFLYILREPFYEFFLRNKLETALSAVKDMKIPLVSTVSEHSLEYVSYWINTYFHRWSL
eukprot:Nk52_evm13s2474 gene=Nk52_evmTU13s2474